MPTKSECHSESIIRLVHDTNPCCERNRHVTNVLRFSLLSLFSQLEYTINGFQLHFQLFRPLSSVSIQSLMPPNRKRHVDSTQRLEQ